MSVNRIVTPSCMLGRERERKGGQSNAERKRERDGKFVPGQVAAKFASRGVQECRGSSLSVPLDEVLGHGPREDGVHELFVVLLLPHQSRLPQTQALSVHKVGPIPSVHEKTDLQTTQHKERRGEDG